MTINNNTLNSLINAAIQTQEVDMTQESTGGGLMPEGYAMARMVTYIEMGKQPQEYQGKAKPAADEFRVGFKLFGGPDNCYDGRFISTFDLSLSNGTKAGAKRLFDRLNWDNSIVHVAQALGKAYLVHVIVAKSKTTGKDSNRIDIDGLLPPIDPVSKGAYPVPEVKEEDLTYFFFEHPTKETWDSLFIDGTWDDGKSKNSIQEKILTAINFAGSPLEQLISGVVLPPTESVQPVHAEVPEPICTPAPTAIPMPPIPPAMPAGFVVPPPPKA